MNDAGVYAEAKGEYTRQLCVFLVPTLEQYFLDLLNEAKQTAPNSSKELLTFQNLLQGIPDWNQDKVLRETGRVQHDCKCDYLEELITAVFIAHTKVLSAIRLTSKQKKLQITIPKLDHFLHRVISECARSLWSNAFLFSGATSIERQKNLRQVEHLLEEAILQGIRGLLPVKSILREYLQEDEDEEKDVEAVGEKEAALDAAASAEPAHVTSVPAPVPAPSTEEIQNTVEKEETERPALDAEHMIPLAPSPLLQPVEVPPFPPSTETGPPVVEIDTSKPSVQFNDKAMIFSESGLEEVDLIEEEPPIAYLAESLDIGAEALPMDDFEDLSKPEERPMSPIQFEELPAA
jgi:hypothetical protein